MTSRREPGKPVGAPSQEAEMKFIFVCPLRNRVFESSDFSIVENKGIITDNTGNRVLDAKVRLENPCPFCGNMHVYSAGELACPFDGSGK